MITKELVEYIKSQLALNVSVEEIRKVLVEQGWREVDINDAFLQARSNKPFVKYIPKEDTSSSLGKGSISSDVNKLKWYDIVFLIPAFAMIILGGKSGLIVGVSGWVMAVSIMRKESLSKPLRIFLLILIFPFSILLHTIVSLIILKLLNQI